MNSVKIVIIVVIVGVILFVVDDLGISDDIVNGNFNSIIEMNEKSEPITYEINTIEEFCNNKDRIFGGHTSELYHQRLRELYDSGDTSYGPYSIRTTLENQYVKDLMWNYKINLDLKNEFERHVKGLEYIDCPSS